MRYRLPTSKADRLDYSYDLIVALLVLLLPLSSALPNLLLAPLGILLFFKYNRNKVNYKHISLFLITIVYLIILALFKFTLFNEMEFYSRLLILLLLVLIIPQVSREKLIIKALITGVFLAILLACFNILRSQGFELSFDSFGNTAAVNELLRIERPYFGFFLAITVFFLLKENNLLSYVLAGVATIFCALIAARLSLGLIVLLWGIKGYQLLDVVKKLRIPILLGAAVLTGVLLFNNDNLRDRFKIGDSIQQSVDRALDYEPRYIIWPCTFSILETTNDVLIGLEGNKQIENRLTACYADEITGNDSKKAYYLSEKFNPHNQFLHLLDLAGLGGILLLLASFLQVFLSASLSGDKKLILLLFMLFFLVEAVLFRQLGCYFTGLGLGYLACNQSKNHKSFQATEAL